MKEKIRQLLNTNGFTAVLLAAILLNALLVGWQTYEHCPRYVSHIQLGLLSMFFVEVLLRWVARESTYAYLSDGWNYFDVFILLAGVLPEVVDVVQAGGGSQSSILSVLRVLRVVQLARSIRAIEELRALVRILVRSLRSLIYIATLFLLVMYIYAVIGVNLFKNRAYTQSEHLQQAVNQPDPWGDVGEGFFTLFRVLTGDDWTELRYNALDNEQTRQNDGMESRPKVSNLTVTVFYVSWIIIAAYLLLNLVLGAIVNNVRLLLQQERGQGT